MVASRVVERSLRQEQWYLQLSDGVQRRLAEQAAQEQTSGTVFQHAGQAEWANFSRPSSMSGPTRDCNGRSFPSPKIDQAIPIPLRVADAYYQRLALERKPRATATG